MGRGEDKNWFLSWIGLGFLFLFPFLFPSPSPSPSPSSPFPSPSPSLPSLLTEAAHTTSSLSHLDPFDHTQPPSFRRISITPKGGVATQTQKDHSPTTPISFPYFLLFVHIPEHFWPWRQLRRELGEEGDQVRKESWSQFLFLFSLSLSLSLFLFLLGYCKVSGTKRTANGQSGKEILKLPNVCKSQQWLLFPHKKEGHGQRGVSKGGFVLFCKTNAKDNAQERGGKVKKGECGDKKKSFGGDAKADLPHRPPNE